MFANYISIGTQGKRSEIIKLLSVDPDNYDDAPFEGIRRLLEIFTGKKYPRNEPLDTSQIQSIRMGTTVATNALLERKGERTALVITKGFKDLLTIGNQSRPRIFDLAISKPQVLYDDVLEIDERVTLESWSENTEAKEIEIKIGEQDLVQGISGEVVRIIKRPDWDKVESDLRYLHTEKGYRSIAIVLAHSYTFKDHEKKVGELASKIGFTHVGVSSDLMPMIKMVPRGTSATADAYLTPEIQKYIAGFTKGFKDEIGGEARRKNGGTLLEFMQSDGGLVDVSKFSGLKAILSGPAGGVVGYALTTYDPKTKIPVIGFDMGGTSTDVSRYGGRFEHVFETTTAGVTIQSPQLDINTVAAGGGSRLFWKNGMFVVGPESASAHPGPACYRKGGPLTVTDANLFLGRILPEFFPKIFGRNEDEPLDTEIVEEKFKKLTAEINKGLESKKTPEEVAHGFIKVANETMARPIRTLTEAKGHQPSSHRLATFGGAGGQHACAIAESLGIAQIVIHKFSSLLSAHGMALADVVQEIQKPSSDPFNEETKDKLIEKFQEIETTARTELQNQGFGKDEIESELYLNMRYQGTDTALMILKPDKSWDFAGKFLKEHEQEFGFTLPGRAIIVDDIRVRGIGKSHLAPDKTVDDQLKELQFKNVSRSKAHSKKSVYFDDRRHETDIFLLKELNVGSRVAGPAIIIDATQTIAVAPSAHALILDSHVVINLTEVDITQKQKLSTQKIDPIMLSVFGHRFMAIAEQMGRVLQKTSVSTNVKERLDYSCALFDSQGGLVANAPHLPVHLGSMSTAVKTQAELWKGKLKPGDVIVSNHPTRGGTHLPDITVITPAFNDGKIIFYVASRAHHADIGGILPGSMPPTSKELYEEGAAIKSEKLVSEGHFDEEKITRLLCEEPSKYPGCSGTRTLRDNINDLKAQVAANKKGISLISALIEEYEEDVVQFYMVAIQKNAELAVRKLLKKSLHRFQGKPLQASDGMDDGSRICLKITITDDENSTKMAVFDFEGTTPEVYGNINAPESVSYSAIIYCLRCLVEDDIPLNQGCLRPIDIIIPKGSFLSPSEGAAVVGGNVLTSQRVTDVVLKAFEACAASQGDTNNLTWGIGREDADKLGTGTYGYYETIAGGSGAGPTWEGVSGVHTHMTNTRITDPEILERRYPVLLHRFSLRPGSGGRGKYKGGDGCIREIEFLLPTQVSILSERRVLSPYGMHGGENAQVGLNLWLRQVKNENSDEVRVVTVNLGSRNTARMSAGDRIIVSTPGGGGYGSVDERKEDCASENKIHARDLWRGTGTVNAYHSTQETA